MTSDLYIYYIYNRGTDILAAPFHELEPWTSFLTYIYSIWH